jgi:SP family general alpha glucoside:H+ symporter-like MFS transporter
MMDPSKSPDVVTPVKDEAFRSGQDSPNSMAKVVENAKSAAQKEQKMTLWQGIKLYPKAVIWSVIISTTIAMEGYDISLVNNFYAFAQFNRKYGELGSDGEYQVPARVNLLFNSMSDTITDDWLGF